MTGSARNLEVIKQCKTCAREYHPLRGREVTSTYCSTTCMRKGVRFDIIPGKKLPKQQ